MSNLVLFQRNHSYIPPPHPSTHIHLTVYTVLHSVLLRSSTPAVLLTRHFTSGLCCREQQQQHHHCQVLASTQQRAASNIVSLHRTTASCSVITIPSMAPVLAATVNFSSPPPRTVPCGYGTSRGKPPPFVTEATPTPCGTLPLGL